MPAVFDLLLILAAGLVGGTLIGAVSVGGVVILPILIGLAGMAPREAIQLTLAGFVATGLAALLRTDRRFVITSLPLLIAAVPGAIVGTIALAHLPPLLVVWLIAGLATTSTLFAMLPRRGAERSVHLAPAAAVSIGALTGFGSALTGSGGPLILTPLLTLLRVSIRPAIQIAQAVQFPIALTATLAQMGQTPLDPIRACLLAGSLIVGLFAGTALQGRVSTPWLKRATNIAVLLTIGLMLISTIGAKW